MRWANPAVIGAVTQDLRFSTDLNKGCAVDPFARFLRYVKLYKEKKLMPVFETLSTWHLGYVIDSPRTDSELDWLMNSSTLQVNGVHISKMSQNEGVLAAVQLVSICFFLLL